MPRTKVDERESGMSPTVLPQFPSTGPTLMSCPRWYTRSAFPVPTASFSPFGTPETRLLYQWCAPVYSMHNKSLLTYIFCPTEQSETVLSGMKSYAYLKQHSFDNQRVGIPGVNVFAHLRVGAPSTECSIGVPDFQVRETIRI